MSLCGCQLSYIYEEDECYEHFIILYTLFSTLTLTFKFINNCELDFFSYNNNQREMNTNNTHSSTFIITLTISLSEIYMNSNILCGINFKNMRHANFTL